MKIAATDTTLLGVVEVTLPFQGIPGLQGGEFVPESDIIKDTEGQIYRRMNMRTTSGNRTRWYVSQNRPDLEADVIWTYVRDWTIENPGKHFLPDDLLDAINSTRWFWCRLDEGYEPIIAIDAY